MKKIKYLIVLIVFSMAAFSCTKAIIDEGAIPEPIDGAIKFDPDIQNIVFNHCVTCHGGAAPSANLDLTTYQNVRSSAENGTLLNRVEDSANPMPPNGLLSLEQRQAIAKWAEDGFPEN